MVSKLTNSGQKRAFDQISRGLARLLAQSETGQARLYGQISGEPFRKLCSGSAVVRAGSAGRAVWTEFGRACWGSSAGHSMPWRAKEAATSSIKSSIGAPNGSQDAGPVGSSFSREILILLMNPPRGDAWQGQTRGEVTASFHPLRRDGFPW